jgi:hypothetical protein
VHFDWVKHWGDIVCIHTGKIMWGLQDDGSLAFSLMAKTFVWEKTFQKQKTHKEHGELIDTWRRERHEAIWIGNDVMSRLMLRSSSLSHDAS